MNRHSCIPQIDQGLHCLVETLARDAIADVVEVHDVALSEQVSREAADVTRFNRKPLSKLTGIREVEAVIDRSDDRVVERRFDSFSTVRVLSQRESDLRLEVPGDSRQQTHIRNTTCERRRQVRAYVVRVDRNRERRRKPELVVQVEVNCELATDAIVGSTESSTEHRFSVTADE